MDLSEFRRRLGADPWSREAETRAARHASAEFEAAAAAAECFEVKLQAAVKVPPPAGLLGDIMEIGRQAPQRRNWMPLALAASLLITLASVFTAWHRSRHWDSVEAYLADHYAHDGKAVLAAAGGVVDEAEVTRIMARLGASVDQELSGRIRFIKFCPTPEGRGAHMVVATGQGPVTVIFMPGARVRDGEVLSLDALQAVLVAVPDGSVAIMGNPRQAVEALAPVIRKSLRSGTASA